MENKGSIIVGYFLSAIAGMFLMYAINKAQGPDIGPDKTASSEAAGDAADHSSSPIPVGKDDPQWGNDDALVTIVEISDFQCPFCSRVNATMKQIKDTYGPDKVRIVWKHNPLPFHKQAGPAHEASAAVHDIAGDEAFWKFHDLAFANQKDLTPENFVKWAKEAGVDEAKFKEAVKDQKYAKKVQADLDANRKIGATGTPAFRINGVTLSGAQPFPKFKTVIDEQVKKAEEMIKSGTPKNQVSLALTKDNFKNAPPPDKDERKEPAEDTTVWRVPVMKDDPVKGAADALVTIVEWSDYQCPFCSRVEPTMKQLMDKYGKDIRIVWKDNALPFHKQAKPAAALARAAYDKGGDALYWKAHEKLFEHQKELKDDGIFQKIGKDLGLSDAEIKAAVEDGKYDERIDQSMELASDLNARGTPHFFINGRRLSGAQPLAKFEELVKSQMAIAEGLVKKGVPRAKVYDELMKTAKGPAEPEKRDVAAPSAANPTKGAKNPKIVIQEFSDFQCPYCSRVNGTIAQILKEYPNDVQVVWRNMPLPFHKDAKLAAEAAQEVFTQKGADAFWAYHDKLFDNQKSLKREDLEKFAQELGGIDMARFKKALDDHTHAKHVEADMEVAQKAGVRGTPAFTVNGYFLSGAQPFPAFDKLIKHAQKQGK